MGVCLASLNTAFSCFCGRLSRFARYGGLGRGAMAIGHTPRDALQDGLSLVLLGSPAQLGDGGHFTPHHHIDSFHKILFQDRILLY